MNMRKTCIDRHTNTAKTTIAALLALSLASGAAAQCQPGAPPTACEPDPIPSGANELPSNSFSVGEYAFVHSSPNLQAEPACTKHAAGLFWNPAGEFGTGVPRAFGAFSSAIIVNNPDPNNPTWIEIDYFGPNGFPPLASSGPHEISPDGTYMEEARRLGSVGIGSAVVRVVNPEANGPIVGSTVHYFDSIAVPGWGLVDDDNAAATRVPCIHTSVPAGTRHHTGTAALESHPKANSANPRVRARCRVRTGLYMLVPARYAVQLPFLPYIGGGADERQFRVMCDRAQSFQVVMGQDAVANLITAESVDATFPLLPAIVETLAFDRPVAGG